MPARRSVHSPGGRSIFMRLRAARACALRPPRATRSRVCSEAIRRPASAAQRSTRAPTPVAQVAARAQDVHVLLHVLGRPAARVGDVGELREEEAELGEEAQHLAGDRLDVVLAAGDDEARDLVADEHAVGDGDLVLDAVHPLDHLVVERAGRAPADRRRHEDDVGPVHEGLVDAVELVGRVHLRDRAGPGAGARALRVVALAGAEVELVEADQARLGAERRLRVRERVGEQLLGGRVARVRPVHHGGRDADHAHRAGLAPDGRASGCGSCGALLRGVRGSASTNTRPLSTLTA